MTLTLERCPKHMTYGPCGSVRAGGACEVDDIACPFVDLGLVRWSGGAPSTAPAHELLDLMQRRRVVLVDLPTSGTDAGVAAATARVLADAGGADAVMLGDSPWARVQLPPSLWASIVADAGLRPWPIVHCRDRNRVALEAELAGLAAIGAAGVLCVTGAHPVSGHRPDAAAVFDLDSTRLAALARDAGLLVAVAETLAAPPTTMRAARLAEKVRAGAQTAFVHHGGDVDALARFACDAERSGAAVPLLACVPLIVDPGVLPWVERLAGGAAGLGAVVAAAADPRGTGIAESLRLAEAALAVPGVAGIALGVVAPPGGEGDAVRAAAEVVAELRGS